MKIDEVITPDLVGQQVPQDTLDVTADLTKNYAESVNDTNPRYYGHSGGSSLIAPPMFGTVPTTRILRNIMRRRVFPLPQNRTVHAAHKITFCSSIQPGDFLISEGKVHSVSNRSTGAIISIATITRSESGCVRNRQLMTLFVKNSISVRQHNRSQPSSCGSKRKPFLSTEHQVDQNQSSRYAKVSFTEGIPVHENQEEARSLGYRTYILQGQCTLSFAATSIVNDIASGVPEKLIKFQARFTQVVYPFDTITTNIWREGTSGGYSFEMTNQDGAVVIADGKAELKP